jgi:2-keto-4-pentenoate hydratase/2-oxohepta-3-ene-1,7-dioic acid hydratase in catechol pathway
MKLVTFRVAERERLGALDSTGAIVDLNAAYTVLAARRGDTGPIALAAARLPADVLGLLDRGPAGLEAAREVLAFVEALEPDDPDRHALRFANGAVRILPPVPRPPKIVCVARNFAEHAEEVGREVPTIPILFARFPATLVADGEPVVRPSVSEQLDWEGELAVVIGRSGRAVRREDAMSHVAGYSILNDVTVRDYQFRVTQYTAGKNFSRSGPFGPYLVTADEISDVDQLEIVTHVNGEQMQRASAGDMVFDIPTLIEHISEFIELEVGDVIATGTPAGVGFKRDPPRFLRPGDIMRVSITGLGTLENPVVAEETIAA